MWIRYWHNDKVLENGNLRIKPGDSLAVENLSGYISKREEVSSTFVFLVRQAWKNYPFLWLVGSFSCKFGYAFIPAVFASEDAAGGDSLSPLMREQTVVGVLWLQLVGSSTKTTSNLRLLCKAFEDWLPADAFWSETMREHFLRHFSLGSCEGNCWTWMDFLQSCFHFFFLLPLNW